MTSFKATEAVSHDLIQSPFPAAALSWALVSTEGAVTFPHKDFGGTGAGIQVLFGRKIWFPIRRKDQPGGVLTIDEVLEHFSPDSPIDPEVFECDVILLEPGTLWHVLLSLVIILLLISCIGFNALIFSMR